VPGVRVTSGGGRGERWLRTAEGAVRVVRESKNGLRVVDEMARRRDGRDMTRAGGGVVAKGMFESAALEGGRLEISERAERSGRADGSKSPQHRLGVLIGTAGRG
jgi:hypothetical protein